jgi:glycosyltransferase involved in cell wall biosynthesis
MTQPEVSILLCAYNASGYIRDAIESSIIQTFSDFELIVVDDGSTDNTVDLVQQFNDERIVLVKSHHCYIHSLNLGIDKCKGKYIARMDADDIMVPTRIATQVELMKHHPDISVCTSWAQAFGLKDIVIGNSVHGEVENAELLFLLGNYLVHPTSFIRRDFINHNSLRYKEYSYAEDYKLWTDIAGKGGKFYVIPKILLNYRISLLQATNKHRQEQINSSFRIQQELIETIINRQGPERKIIVNKLYDTLLESFQAGIVAPQLVVNMMYKVLRGFQ